MASKEKGEKILKMSNFRKNIVKLVLGIGVPLIIFLVIDLWPGVYEFKVNGIVVGYVKDKTFGKNQYNELIKEIDCRFSITNKNKDTLEFSRIDPKDINTSSEDEIKNNIIGLLNMQVTAKKMILNNYVVGYVASEEEGKEILKNLPQKYIDNKNKENIISINVNTDAKYIDEKVALKEIKTQETIIENIIKINKEEKIPAAKVDISVKELMKANVEPNIKVISTSTLYLGESKKQQGISGQRQVVKKVTYTNGNISKTDVLEEKILTPQKDTIILNGSKNPIGVGVAFLTRPTARGAITSPYGSRWGGTHHGMDIGASFGDPIGAALEGTVEYVGYSSIYGNMIILNHGGGIETVYGHASEILTKVGRKVNKGDIIAKVGSTGRSTGPHLHFELRYNGVAINPAAYIKVS